MIALRVNPNESNHLVDSVPSSVSKISAEEYPEAWGVNRRYFSTLIAEGARRCRSPTGDRRAASVEPELPEKERPDIGIAGNRSARYRAAPMSRFLFATHKDRAL